MKRQFLKHILASVSYLIVGSCLASASVEEIGTINISVIDSEDIEIGVLSAVLSGTAALAQEAMTDSNGKLLLPRQCKPGEQIQAKPIEEVVYEPSGAMTCSPELQIKVRRRPFAESGVVAFSAADYLGHDGKARLAITKVLLSRNLHTLEPQAGTGPSCEISFAPETTTIVYDEKGNMTYAQVKEFRNDTAWNDIPRMITLGSHCDDANSAVQELTDSYVRTMTGKVKSEGFGTAQWLANEWNQPDQSQYFQAAAHDSKSMTWICEPRLCN